MSHINDILKVIETLKKSNKILSKEDVITLLHAAKNISDHKEFIDNLIFFYTTLNTEYLSKAILLTEREKQIVHIIGLGHQNHGIAFQLNLSVSTVETHRKNIRKKLNLSGNGALLKFAIINNLQNTISVFNDDI